MRVLVVEDDVQLARQIASALTEAAHDPVTVHNGERALDKAKEKPFDLVVLDVILPGMDGFDVLRHLRSEHIASRVLMLTARGEVKDRITGLQLGADDYLPKPFAMRELVARVSALGRRYPEEPVLNLHVGDLTLDLVNHHVHRGPRRIELSVRELMLLKVLMREPGRVFTRAQLLDAIRGVQVESFDRAIDAHVKNLRRKLEPDPRNPRYVLTVHGVGYKFAD